jgi:hypothetical protein
MPIYTRGLGGFKNNVPSGSVSFNPNTYGTTLAWYNPRDNTKVLNGSLAAAADGEGVDTITDSSSYARNARQTTSGSRPIYETNIQNGKNVLRFDDSADFLSLPSSNAITNGITGITIVQVYSLTSTVGTNGLFEFQTGSAGRRFSLAVLAGGQFEITCKREDGAGGGSRYGGTNTASTWYIVVTIWDVSAGTCKVYQNGSVSIASGAIDTAGTVSATSSVEAPTIGSYGLYGSTLFGGDMGDIVIWQGAMSDVNRDAMETALGAEWAITVA